ncbi:Uncharacterized protein ESCO_003141 [Escovopsis weberi]|uniref:ATP synthase F0 n=1 Tax=Escovopsis weberi TaxID=150374 RepID=A0A0M9VSD3_ESCWE|nr:Uncharacterized protein ESCO_003141 [Escovopsis weberi]
MADWNPFVRRETHSVASIRAHKVLAILTWILSVVVSVYYTARAPDGVDHGGLVYRRIWKMNYLYPSAFTMNNTIAEIYWLVLFVLQVVFVLRLFSRTPDTASAAANVSSHFVANNLLHAAFVALFVRSRFAWAELVLLLNLANLTALYFRHNATASRVSHVAVASGPLAWTFVAVYWNGALMVRHPADLVPRVLGNVFIWSLLAFGVFFLVAYKDYTMGFNLSVLAAAIGVAQFKRQAVALQWIFAFVIMGLLFVMTLAVVVPAWSGRAAPWKRSRPGADPEHAPLLEG